VSKLKSVCLKALPIFLLLCLNIGASNKVLPIADSFRANHFYNEAVTEYLRYLFFNPDCDAADEIYSSLGFCLAGMEQWEQAFKAMDQAFDRSGNDSLTRQRRVDRAVVLMAAGKFDESQFDLMNAAHRSAYKNITDRADILLFLSTLLTKDWPTASQLYHDKIKLLISSSDSLEAALLVAVESNYKSPSKAQLLSTLIPGLGQVYCGRWLDGLNALLLNGALGYLTIDCFAGENYTGGILSFVFLFHRYYNGNRGRAYNVALEYNQRVDSKNQIEILRIFSDIYPSLD
jgi:tetratricopeptide (TPR) repeat protein